jgi:CHASE3 domain sensor protein
VQAELGANYNAILTNQVVDLADEGKAEEAVQILRKRSDELSTQAVHFNNDLLKEQSDKLKQRADELEKEGMGKSMRKMYRADSYQTINQQSNR